MPNLSRAFIFLIFILLHFGSTAQVIINGKVLCNGKKVRDVTISARSTATLFLPAQTGRSGTFEIETSGRGDQLSISKKGYIPQTIAIVDERHLVINLKKAPRRKIELFKGNGKSKCPPGNPLCACCFYKGTRILLKDGQEKKIEQLKPGDLILNTNLKDFTVRVDTVFAIDSVIHDNLIKITLENKVTITSTTDHPYFVEGKGWCSFDKNLTTANYSFQVKDLRVGDRCLAYSEGKLKPLTIVRITPLNQSGMTYNISGLYNQSNYFANGILVSNEKEVSPLSEK